MGGLKQHMKLIAAVAMLMVAAIIMLTQESSPYPAIPDRFDYVCVSTGELFNLSNEEAARIPARHPKTGVATLIPCIRKDDGSIAIEEGFRDTLEGELSKYNHVVDMETLQVEKKDGA
ncbi:MAG: hypothetical protein DHS20C16_05810 [Phycisphaerae bacterium]|nr:MAG: hypothetical protein DHS20C16_05810 [Phycisphaerae bacterium]